MSLMLDIRRPMSTEWEEIVERHLPEWNRQVEFRVMNPEVYITEPMEPGEEIPRQYVYGYHAARQRVRNAGPVWFDVGQTLRVANLAQDLMEVPGARESPELMWAAIHLREATIETLTDEARTQHVDIAAAFITMMGLAGIYPTLHLLKQYQPLGVT